MDLDMNSKMLYVLIVAKFIFIFKKSCIIYLIQIA